MAPLQQINLKVPEPVAVHWRAQAAATGLSVRDWLVSITAPTAEVLPAAAGGSDLAERVARLEAAAVELREAVAALQVRPPRSPRPAPAPDQVPDPRKMVAPPAEGIESVALADLLGIKRGTFNARLSRLGGAREGLEVDGWRCLGLRPAERGGPPRARWLPAG